MPRTILDVSKWQGEIDVAAVADDGVEVVYIRSSVGSSYVDPYFERNYTQAKANGLKVGFYHYVNARTVEEAQQEAQFFAATVRGKQPECRLAMDFEYFGDLTVDQINAISRAFLETLQQASGKEVALYSNSYQAANVFAADLAVYPLWVAEYGVSAPAANGKWSSCRLSVYQHRPRFRHQRQRGAGSIYPGHVHERGYALLLLRTLPALYGAPRRYP